MSQVALPARTTTAVPSTDWSRTTRLMVLGGILLLAFALFMVDLGGKSIWFDESITAAIARQPTHTFLHTIFNDEANMGLYYVIMRGWAAIGGTGATWMRFLSAIFGVAGVAVLYCLARRLFDFERAALAALLLALNGFYLQFAQEARSYELTALLGIISTYLFVRAVDDDGWSWWVLYAVTIGLAINAHLFAVTIPFGHLAALPFRGSVRDRWRRPVVALGGAFVLGLPAFKVALERRNTQVWWNPPLTVGRVRSVFAAAAGGGGIVLALSVAGCIALAAWAGWKVWRTHGPGDDAWPWAIALLGYAVPTLLILALCAAEKIIQIRYFSITLPQLALVVSLGLWQLRPRLLLAAGVVVVVLFSCLGVARWYRADKEDWRDAVAVTQKRGTASDGLILVDPYRVKLVDYYRHPDSRGPALDYPPSSFNAWPLYRNHQWVGDAKLARLAETHNTIWVLNSAVDPLRDTRAIRRELARTHDLVKTYRYTSVSVDEWRRKP